MIIKQINNEDEVVLGSFFNNAGADLVDGDCVLVDTTAGATVVGRYMVGSATAGGELNPLGVVWGKTIPSAAYGLVLVYGVHRNVKGVAGINATKLPLMTGTTARLMGTGTTAGAYMGFSLTAVVAGRFQAFIKGM